MPYLVLKTKNTLDPNQARRLANLLFERFSEVDEVKVKGKTVILKVQPIEKFSLLIPLIIGLAGALGIAVTSWKVSEIAPEISKWMPYIGLALIAIAIAWAVT